jgi:hypothetical protein
MPPHQDQSAESAVSRGLFETCFARVDATRRTCGLKVLHKWSRLHVPLDSRDLFSASSMRGDRLSRCVGKSSDFSAFSWVLRSMVSSRKPFKLSRLRAAWEFSIKQMDGFRFESRHHRRLGIGATDR